VGQKIAMKASAFAALAAGLALAGTAVAQTDSFTVDGGRQPRTWQGEANIPRGVPTPFHKIFNDNDEEIIIATLGALPWKPGKVIGTSYHVAYFTRKSLDKALDEGHKNEEARLILIGQDAAKLKQLIDAGKNPDTDKEAGALYLKLQKQISSEATTSSFAAKALVNHLPYAVAREGLEELVSFSIEKWTERVGLKWLIRRLGLGKGISRGWREEVKMTNQLLPGNWIRLKARAQAVHDFFDAYQKALLDHAISKKAGDYASKALDHKLAELEAEIRKKHPSSPAPSGPILVRGNLRQLVQIQPAAMAAVAAAAPIAVFAAPPAVEPIARIPDPVVQSIYLEDSFVYERRSSSTTSSPSSSTTTTEPPKPPPQPPQRKRNWNWKPPTKGPNWDGRKQ
jgi:hypothetical protein